MTGVLIRRGYQDRQHRQRDNHGRRQEDGSHLQAKERGFRRNQTCLHFDLKTSSLQNRKKISFCCLSHPVCGILLWQPQQTYTTNNTQKAMKIRTKEINECLAYVFVIMPSKDIFLNVSFYVLHSISPFHLESPHSIHLAIEEDARLLHEPDFLSLVNGPRWAF